MHRPERILNDLIATCRDSAEGFGKAAKGAHSDELRQQLTNIEKQPFRIRRPAHANGGRTRRGWVDLETRIRPEVDGHLIDECRRGEEGTLKHFESALGRPEFPERARPVVEQELARIRQDLSRLGNATSSAGRTSL